MRRILRNTALIGSLFGVPTASLFPLHYMLLPSDNPQADLTVVVTGGEDRVKDALTDFKKSCQTHQNFLMISGASSEPKVIIEESGVELADDCKDRIIFESHALNTTGNAQAIVAVVDKLEREKGLEINTIRLTSSWYHLPRLVYEAEHMLDRSKIFSTKKFGNCDDFSCASKMIARETIALASRYVGWQNSKSWNPQKSVQIGL